MDYYAQLRSDIIILHEQTRSQIQTVCQLGRLLGETFHQSPPRVPTEVTISLILGTGEFWTMGPKLVTPISLTNPSRQKTFS